MSTYKYTDKLLFALAIGNLWIVVPSVWTAWIALAIVRVPHQGDTGELVVNVLWHTIIGIIVLCSSAWVFFKRWRFALYLYILYLSFPLPIYFYAAIQFLDNKMLGFLDSKIYTFSYLSLFFLALITLITMLIETDYRNLKNKWLKSCKR